MEALDTVWKACDKEFAAFERVIEAFERMLEACKMMLKAEKFVSTIENIVSTIQNIVLTIENIVLTIEKVVSTIEKFVWKAGFQIEKWARRTWPRVDSRAKIAHNAPANIGTPFLSRTRALVARAACPWAVFLVPLARAWRPQAGTSRPWTSFPPPAPLSRSPPPFP